MFGVLEYLDFGIVLIDCHFVKFKSLFVTVKYGHYESLRLPRLNTNGSPVLLGGQLYCRLSFTHSSGFILSSANIYS